jgi:hypothetical protein
MKIPTNRCSKIVTGAGVVLAATASVFADGPSAALAAPASTNAVTTFFNTTIPEAFSKGKFSLNARARYENVDQEGGTPGAHAETLRTRFGFTTAPVYGVQGMIEAENVTAASKKTYAPGPGSPVQRDIIADPTGTEINQAWLAYAYSTTNFSASVKGGRQMITLDNQRFVGNVGWRQNSQTFDAAALKLAPLKGLDLFYGYLWNVNRIFGDDPSLAAGTSDFKSDSHLINASYAISPLFKLTGYGYLLDLQNARGGNAANSCATAGGFVSGTWTFDKEQKGTLGYRGEFALQSDYADSPVDYETEYYLVDLKATLSRFNAGLGVEVLGADNNQGFRTPLATLHAFNGWADVFLNTPTTGLQDMYASVGVLLPGEVPLNFIAHKFNSDAGSADFGQEYDIVASRKFGKNWTALVKYAYYDGKEAIPGVAAVPFDKQVFWAELEFNF